MAAATCWVETVYCPAGDATVEDLNALLLRQNDFVVAGDLNAHHPSWGRRDRSNKCGASLKRVLDEAVDVHLLTPPGLGTRIDPVSGSSSTLDITLASPKLAFLLEEVHTGPFMSSDHIPVISTFKNTNAFNPSRHSKWRFDSANWQAWNEKVEEALGSNFLNETDLNEACRTFTNALVQAGKNQFRYGPVQPCNNRKPWWTAECARACAQTRKLERIWRTNPDDTQKKLAFRKAEAVKKRIIIKAKRTKIDELLATLGRDKDTKRLWGTVNAFLGKNRAISLPPARIIKEDGRTTYNEQEIADSLLEKMLEPNLTIPSQSKAREANRVARAIMSSERVNYNEPISVAEVYSACENLRNSAPGPDLLNSSFKAGKLPDAWKEAVIIPLLKQGKPNEKVDSYRPIALTSALCKLLEKIIMRRLTWILEMQGAFRDHQHGFRPGRSTTTALLNFDWSVKEGWREGGKVYAILLDISKAFDSISPSKVSYALARYGVKGRSLKWINDFMETRTYQLRIGGSLSAKISTRRGVPQGAVLSPQLFNVLMSTFPKPPDGVTLITYADDVTILAAAEKFTDAEHTLQPYLDKIVKWGKLNDLSFSAEKSVALCLAKKSPINEDPVFFMGRPCFSNSSEM